jgi:cell division septal protein FtsQ
MWLGRKGKTAAGPERRNGGTGPRAPRERRAPGVAPIPKIAWIPFAAIAAVACIYFLVCKTGELLFWDNPAYTIRKVDIRIEGQAITAGHVREYTGIGEGTNLFAINLGRVQADFLRKTPHARSIVLQRKLPDTVAIMVTERMPLARLGRGSALGVDRDGHVFSLRGGPREYPAITGCPEGFLRPGARVDQPVLNAIEVIDACNRVKAGELVKIASVDVSSRESLDMYLAAGEKVRINWTGMGAPVTADGRREIEKKIGHLADVLRADEERGRRVVNLDLTYGDNYVPAQEY